MHALLFFLALAFVLLFSPNRAEAYIDPASGSFILQMLLAAIFGAMFAIKSINARIRLFFSRLLGKETPSSESAPQPSAETEDDEQ